jgi:hypothetical protein
VGLEIVFDTLNEKSGNLLSHFEFIFVLVSIILGLGLANLFGGISRQLQQPWNELDGVHLAFAFCVVLSTFVVWWGMYRWQNHAQFEFGTFLVIALYTSIFYAMSVVLYPRDGSLRTFNSIRTEVADFDRPSFYWYTYGPTIGLVIAAMWMRKKTLDGLVAAYWIVLWSGWWFVAKFGG